ncbi:MAG: substrate-binding periplasmic protein [Marinobacter sp.]|uniref:substrate-binding periplasmic protein n=1 Tax=Marinobacter sp. TaxID=50741 RepID=UPI003F9CDFDC
MEYRPLAFGILALLIFQVCMAQPAELDLVTFEAPPYQSVESTGDKQRAITGETVETVTCAAKQAGWPVHITLAPQKRAIYSLKRNDVDGYFAADPSAELDSIARRSNPIALEKWYFFTPNSTPKPDKRRIGVVDGGNEEAWLKANGYTVYLGVVSASQLPALLKRERIDAALIDERVMEGLNIENNSFIDSLNPQFLRYAPLHLYVAKVFDATHPEFLPAFNQALPACMEKTLTLSSQESKHIEELAKTLIAELTEFVDVQSALKAGPKQESLAEILSIDSKWQALAPETELPLASHILSLPASQNLKAWQSSHQGLVTEIMVINNMGAITAMSQLTSDFWQGDEPEFLEVAGGELSEESLDRKAFFISSIRYDHSTTRFQISVSMPVIPGSNHTPNGVIVLGLDIEKAMGI